MHEYLGVPFDYSEDGIVKIDMVDYVKDMIEDSPMQLKTTDTAMTPTGDNLFEIGKGKELTKDKAEAFHRSVAKGLFFLREQDLISNRQLQCYAHTSGICVNLNGRSYNPG